MELFKLSFDNMSILLYFLKIEIRIMEIQLTFHLLNIVITFVFITTFDIRLRASKWKVNWTSIILISIFK
jgi:hypothetical protein